MLSLSVIKRRSTDDIAGWFHEEESFHSCQKDLSIRGRDFFVFVSMAEDGVAMAGSEARGTRARAVSACRPKTRLERERQLLRSQDSFRGSPVANELDIWISPSSAAPVTLTRYLSGESRRLLEIQRIRHCRHLRMDRPGLDRSLRPQTAQYRSRRMERRRSDRAFCRRHGNIPETLLRSSSRSSLIGMCEQLEAHKRRVNSRSPKPRKAGIKRRAKLKKLVRKKNIGKSGRGKKNCIKRCQ